MRDHSRRRIRDADPLGTQILLRCGLHLLTTPKCIRSLLHLNFSTPKIYCALAWTRTVVRSTKDLTSLQKSKEHFITDDQRATPPDNIMVLRR